ncbi:MAG TPA: N-methyl-L-tryptophan oxidase [Ktedonobacteraceae bacterium]|nr:N-methyl-L-tryptophan oxidase [Ktedonobacteraceae bacterium]
MVGHERIIIIGAGIVGLSTAYALLKQGRRRVTLLEQAAIDHPGGTSHGFSRLLRFEYGPDALYSSMVRLSLERWKRLEKAVGCALYTPTGVLLLGCGEDNFIHSSYDVMRGMGLPVEYLDEEQCNKRFPQFGTHARDAIAYNAEGGILHASACLRTLRDLVLDMGGKIVETSRVIRVVHRDRQRPLQLLLSSGEVISAERVVIAAGPWLHSLLPEVELPVRMTRQYLLYFAGLPTASYEAGTFPAFLAGNLYGFPIHRGCNGWVKAASHDFGHTVSPDDRTPPDKTLIDQVRNQLGAFLPALRDAPLARIDSCMYDVSPDEHFILDRLPDDPRVVVATGLSGHGFKFGLLLGELLCSMLCETEPLVPLERFSLDRFAGAGAQDEPGKQGDLAIA